MLTESMIKSFLAVAKSLNFTKAAESLYLTQQAVSRNVSALEKELQVPLLDRDTHSVKLTEYGTIYFEQLQNIVQEYETLVFTLKAKWEAQQNQLRLGIVDSPDFVRFKELSKAAEMALSQELHLQISDGPPDYLEEQLRAGQLDAVITLDRLLGAEESLRCLKLKNTRMKLGVSRRNRLFQEGADWSHYANEPLILQTEAGKHIYAEDHFMNQLVQKIALHPSAVIIMTDFSKIQSLVEEGRGIMLCTEMTSNLHEEEIQLFDLPAGQANYVYTWRGDLPDADQSKIRAFGEYLASQIGITR